MTCEARRLLFDYYREKPRKSCPARLPRFFLKMPEICARPIKALRRRAFRLDGLITPTLKAAGSNPVGHTQNVLMKDAAQKTPRFCAVFSHIYHFFRRKKF